MKGIKAHRSYQCYTSVYRSIRNKCTIRVALVFHLYTFFAFACKKFVTVPLPGSEVSEAEIFSNDIAARSAILGIYGEMIGENGFASGNTRSASLLCALSADELETRSALATIREFRDNAIDPGNSAIRDALWGQPYKCIYAANALLIGLEKSDKVSPGAKKQLSGEALFARAFCYFYLANLFGDVPYTTQIDYGKNRTLPRSSRGFVYEQIAKDLKEAGEKLSEAYINNEPSNDNRIRPNKWAATALLARISLYMEKWTDAEAQAGAVIANTDQYNLEDSLNEVFLIRSREAIWQLKPNTPGINTWEGRTLILSAAPTSGESNSSWLSRQVMNAFEPGDLRRLCWVDSIIGPDKTVYHYASKYKIKNGDTPSEYSMVLRLAEQYLIRAEARLKQGDLAGAGEDLNKIRKRAGLPEIKADATDSLLAAILKERQLELFTEWGHRWLDLKRYGKAGVVLKPIKADQWQEYDTLYPIPRSELLLNQKLTQNDGYN